MRVAIVGTGRLGSALGRRLHRAGHELMFAGGDAEAMALELGAGFGTNADAVTFSEVAALCVPFSGVAQALSDAGCLRGKVIWSCVNAMKPDYSGLAIGFDSSAAEEVARLAPEARVVEAIPPFADALASGRLAYESGLTPTVFVCGDEPNSKEAVFSLVRDLGLNAVDAGGLTAARLVEPALLLVVSIASGVEPREVGLRLLERRAEALR
jgi:predicted dinucleotide-binding enzyme